MGDISLHGGEVNIFILKNDLRSPVINMIRGLCVPVDDKICVQKYVL